MYGCLPVALKLMAVCKDITFVLLQRGVCAYVRIAKGKEEFLRCWCRSFYCSLIGNSTGGNKQGVEERQNKRGPGRHRIDSGYVAVAQKSGDCPRNGDIWIPYEGSPRVAEIESLYFFPRPFRTCVCKSVDFRILRRPNQPSHAGYALVLRDFASVQPLHSRQRGYFSTPEPGMAAARETSLRNSSFVMMCDNHA